jgi:hypothetical protein
MREGLSAEREQDVASYRVVELEYGVAPCMNLLLDGSCMQWGNQKKNHPAMKIERKNGLLIIKIEARVEQAFDNYASKLRKAQYCCAGKRISKFRDTTIIYVRWNGRQSTDVNRDKTSLDL